MFPPDVRDKKTTNPLIKNLMVNCTYYYNSWGSNKVLAKKKEAKKYIYLRSSRKNVILLAKKKGCYCIWLPPVPVQLWHKSPCRLSLSALRKILRREEECTCNTLTLRHAPNQTWNALAGIIHTTAWAENSRNTARCSGSPGDVPALFGLGSSTGSSSGLHGTAGSSWDHSFPQPPVFTFWSVTPRPCHPPYKWMFIWRAEPNRISL